MGEVGGQEGDGRIFNNLRRRKSDRSQSNQLVP